MKIINYNPDPDKLPQLSPEQEAKLAALTDEEIDYCDLSELDDNFWQNAETVSVDLTQPITLRIKSSVLKYFQADSDKDYRSRINAVLENYVREQKQE